MLGRLQFTVVFGAVTAAALALGWLWTWPR